MVILNPEKGKLLVAEPSTLNDNSFNRSIILLTEYTEDSAVGFIMNKPLNFTVNDLLPDIECQFTVYQGGPVEQDNLYFIHKIPELIPNSTKVVKDIYWGGNFDSLKDLLSNNKIKSSDIRFLLGYSGWSSNQLNEELQANSWFVSENDFPNILAVDNTSIWKNKLLQKGGKYKIWSNAPRNIQLN